MFLLLFILFVSVGVGVDFGIDNCDTRDATFLTAAGVLFDGNHDGTITLGELTTGYNALRYKSTFTPEWIMRSGDLNQDGVIDMTDWFNTTRTFYKNYQTQMITCFYMRQNGIAMSAKKKK